MKSEDLRLEELVQFSEGRVDLHGRRLVIHSIHAFAQLRRDLLEMVGLEQTRRILTRFGYFWGQADAAAMDRVFQWHDLKEWLKAGLRLQALQGVTTPVLKKLDLDEEKKTIHMEIIWYHSGEADEHLIAFGKVDFPVCRILSGYASGYVSYCLGRDVYFAEQKCRAKGDRVCSATGKDEASWGDEIQAFLPYFRADDIQGKIKTLTRQLRQKSRLLAEQRKKLSLLEKSPKPSVVEVRSRSYRRVLDLARRVAPFDSSVFITGESGVGKEVLARYIHNLSHRSKGPFLAVNCGALPETLLESELFGHKRGSFTGAVQDRRGLFEQAAKGTLLLDEIGDISPAMQVKLLRVLQEREIVRVGESQPRKVDVRIIAATNKDLPAAIEAGEYREDLYYRLRVIEIEIPPLRERVEDILPLMRYFVKRFAEKMNVPGLRLDATCLDYLQRYPWPGNVRELENAIERAAVLCRDELILPQDLPPVILQAKPPGLAKKATARALAEVEQEHIEQVLQSVEGNRTKAAEILGISSATLWRKLKAQGK